MHFYFSGLPVPHMSDSQEFLLCSQFHPRSLHLYAILVLCERFQPSLSCFFHLLKVNKSIGIIKAPSRTHWESLHMSTCPSRSEKRHSSLIYVSKCFLFFSCPESFLNDKHSFYGEWLIAHRCCCWLASSLCSTLAHCMLCYCKCSHEYSWNFASRSDKKKTGVQKFWCVQ